MEEKKPDFGASAGLLILRVGVCGFMATHGWGKVQMVLAGEFDKFADPIGLGVGPSLVLAAGAEFLCALLVMAGFLTRLAAVPPVITMAVAAFKVHAADPWTMGEGASKEPALLYLTVFLALMFLGAGPFSVDDALARRRAAAARPAPPAKAGS